MVSYTELEPATPVLIRLLSPPSMATSAYALKLEIEMAAEYSPIHEVTLSIRPIFSIFSNCEVNLPKLFEGEIKLFIEVTMLLIIVATYSEVFWSLENLETSTFG